MFSFSQEPITTLLSIFLNFNGPSICILDIIILLRIKCYTMTKYLWAKKKKFIKVVMLNRFKAPPSKTDVKFANVTNYRYKYDLSPPYRPLQHLQDKPSSPRVPSRNKKKKKNSCFHLQQYPGNDFVDFNISSLLNYHKKSKKPH
jgi:hypothetical protein